VTTLPTLLDELTSIAVMMSDRFGRISNVLPEWPLLLAKVVVSDSAGVGS